MTPNLVPRLQILFTSLMLAISLPLYAEDPVTPPPELTDDEATQHLPKPEVTIIKREGMVVEEYRVNGRLRYAKIIPTTGPAYYMVDTDGDGELDRRHGDLKNPPVQQWLLYQW